MIQDQPFSYREVSCSDIFASSFIRRIFFSQYLQRAYRQFMARRENMCFVIQCPMIRKQIEEITHMKRRRFVFSFIFLRWTSGNTA